MRSVFIFLFLFLIGKVYGQEQQSCTYSIEGRIFDLKTKAPLPFASVKIKGTTIGDIADENGYFKIENLCETEFNLLFSYVGYKPVTHHHDSYHDIPEIYLAPDNLYLNSVIIEGEKVSGKLESTSRQKIDTRVLEKKQMASLGEITNELSGVSMLQTGQNIAKPIIHGLHSNRVLIINNGIRHEFQNWGDEHAPEVDASMANQIVVVKGASTVRYGPDALGGVLLIDPKPLPLNTGLEGEMSSSLQSNGRGGNVNGSFTYGLENWSFHTEGKILRLGDAQAPDYNMTNTSRIEKTLAGGVRYHKKSIDFEAHYSRVDQELGILRGSVTGNLNDLERAITEDFPLYTSGFSYELDNPRQEITHDMVKLKGSYLSGEQVINLTYGFQRNIRKEFDVRRGTNNEIPSIDLELFTQSLDIDWDHPNLGDLNGLIGIQWLYQDNNNLPGTNTVPFIPNFNNTRLGVFMTESLETGNSKWEAGLRYDYQHTSARGREPDNDIYRNSIEFHNVTATVGLVRKLGQNKSFRTNIGTSWRPPNVSELFSFGKRLYSVEYGLWRYQEDENNQIVVSDVLNNRQKPVPSEVGYKWINTFSYEGSDVKAEFTAYLNYIENYIYQKPAGITNTVRGAFPFFVYDQDNAIFWGLDADWDMQHNERWESNASASYVWAKDISNDDFFIGIPPANFRYTLSYELAREIVGAKVRIDLTSNYTFTQFQTPRTIPISTLLSGESEDLFAIDDSNFDLTDAPDGYFLLGADISFKWKKSSLIFQSDNILNQSYRLYTDRLRYFADQPGTNFQISYTYRL